MEKLLLTSHCKLLTVPLIIRKCFTLF